MSIFLPSDFNAWVRSDRGAEDYLTDGVRSPKQISLPAAMKAVSTLKGINLNYYNLSQDKVAEVISAGGNAKLSDVVDVLRAMGFSINIVKS